MKRPGKPASSSNSSRSVRCAVYTRKSTDEGLDREFNSLDAQREAAEAYVKSQVGEGWRLVPDRYDDGGFTGGNMDRPALTKLLRDIESGKIDCVVVYKIDRFSRSLPDFARMMQVFESKNVAFVSVTQQFNTGTSMGRLMMNVLLSFAQFEREIIGERTRDKMAATRRKGKYAGGTPVLGYDVENGARLIVNELEAQRIRQIFALYLQHGSLLPVVKELITRGWRNKSGVTKQGIAWGGKPFTRTSLYKILINVVYVGKVRYRDEIHSGEHPAIIDDETWRRTQAQLARNGRGGSPVRNKQAALLKGLIRCSACDCAMTPSHSKRGNRLYRYYVCMKAQKSGWDTCPMKSVPAAQIEGLVLDRIARIGLDPDVRLAVLAHDPDLAPADAASALREFTAIWDTLSPKERVRAVRLLVEKVDFDAVKGRLAISFRPTGIKALSQEFQGANV